MGKIRGFFNYLGLGILKADVAEEPQPVLKYDPQKKSKNKDDEKLKLHRDFLKSLEAEENNRLTLIENKTTQMIAQTSVIFALLSLAIPLVVDKIDDFYLKLLVFIPLILAFVFYLLTIHNAAKNFDVKNFNYSRSLATNVIKFKDASSEAFLIEEINDLLYSTKTNLEINNIKGSNLIYSYNCFKIANLFTAILGIVLCVSLLFIKQEKEPIKIKNPIRIEHDTKPIEQPHYYRYL